MKKGCALLVGSSLVNASACVIKQNEILQETPHTERKRQSFAPPSIRRGAVIARRRGLVSSRDVGLMEGVGQRIINTQWYTQLSLSSGWSHTLYRRMCTRSIPRIHRVFITGLDHPLHIRDFVYLPLCSITFILCTRTFQKVYIIRYGINSTDIFFLEVNKNCIICNELFLRDVFNENQFKLEALLYIISVKGFSRAIVRRLAFSKARDTQEVSSPSNVYLELDVQERVEHVAALLV